MLIGATETAAVARVTASEPASNGTKQRRENDSAPASRVAPRPSSEASSSKPTESSTKPADADQPSTNQATAAASQSGNTPSEYRLVYDEEFSRTFIQIVDRTSGEEILRFPPEELVKFIDRSIGRPGAGDTSGLFLDRSV